MTFKAFIEKRYQRKTLDIIEKANEIIAEYQAEGYSLTLRQLYYQFVSRDYIENSDKSYDRLGSIISDARLTGHISWYAIEDRHRSINDTFVSDDVASIIAGTRGLYQPDMWAGQPRRVEVWIEKDALIGTIERVCQDLHVAYTACKGYTSQSEQYRAAQRMRNYMREGQEPLILYLGDHDPSGIDMTRDHRDRLRLLTGGAPVEVRRLALNRDQVDLYQPPPNPAKESDCRFKGYQEEHGNESWELDALPPRVIAGLVTQAVMEVRDHEAWARQLEDKERGNRILDNVIDYVERKIDRGEIDMNDGDEE